MRLRDTTVSPPAPDSLRLLTVYLNDHLGGASGGIELTRRLRAANRENPELGPELAALCAEIEADRRALRRAMELLGVPAGRLKPIAAWVGEKLGRLKLNGRLRGDSPLGPVLELEMLTIGIAGKAQLWRALELSAPDRLGEIDPSALATRAERQRERAEDLHRIAVGRAFGAARAGPEPGSFAARRSGSRNR